MRAAIRHLHTPGWLLEQARQIGPVPGRHRLIVDGFDWPVLKSYLERLVDSCTGADWTEVTGKLARYGHWEFEAYRS